MIRIARSLVTSKNTALSTVRLQPSSFQVRGAYSGVRTNARERRVLVTFKTANAPTAIEHNLGFVPSGFEVLGKTGGRIISDFPLTATRRMIVLQCDTANMVADILVR
jgi:hypothetical protein